MVIDPSIVRAISVQQSYLHIKTSDYWFLSKYLNFGDNIAQKSYSHTFINKCITEVFFEASSSSLRVSDLFLLDHETVRHSRGYNS